MYTIHTYICADSSLKSMSIQYMYENTQKKKVLDSYDANNNYEKEKFSNGSCELHNIVLQ